ncbi:HAD family hydrolase [Catenovulum agarivorans]|uniref:HAD family hydrolase n=1 Tax=Catenovulum agarivorans TaxID=1172192 RepID=UPI0002DF93C0|nr:HAD hydrolase-like protein [Catenovulum agarivorans]
MKFTDVIFDFDGVLSDTVPLKEEAFVQALKDLLTTAESIEKVRQLHRENGGVPRFNKLKIMLKELDAGHSEESVDLRVSMYSAALKNMLSGAVIEEECCSVIAKLAENNVRLHINSAGDKSEIEAFLARFDLLPYFTRILGNENSKKSNIRSIMEEFELDNSSALFIGDSNEDLLTAEHFDVAFVKFERYGSNITSTKYPSLKTFSALYSFILPNSNEH